MSLPLAPAHSQPSGREGHREGDLAWDSASSDLPNILETHSPSGLEGSSRTNLPNPYRRKEPASGWVMQKARNEWERRERGCVHREGCCFRELWNAIIKCLIKLPCLSQRLWEMVVNLKLLRPLKGGGPGEGEREEDGEGLRRKERKLGLLPKGRWSLQIHLRSWPYQDCLQGVWGI